MALITASQLFDEAKQGKHLSASERRHAIAWYVATQDEHLTNVEMAKIFNVTERTIRVDFKKIRDQMLQEVSETKDVGFIVTDVMQEFNKQIRDLERGKRELEKNKKVGNEIWLKTCLAILDTRLKVIKSLQELGWVPKGSGTTTKDETIYVAEVAQDGSIETKKLKKITETTTVENRQERVIDVKPETEYVSNVTTFLPASDKVN